METGVKIGADATAAQVVGDVILNILNAPTGGRAKMAALKALQKSLTVKNVTVSDTHIDGRVTHEAPEFDINKLLEALGVAQSEGSGSDSD